MNCCSSYCVRSRTSPPSALFLIGSPKVSDGENRRSSARTHAVQLRSLKRRTGRTIGSSATTTCGAACSVVWSGVGACAKSVSGVASVGTIGGCPTSGSGSGVVSESPDDNAPSSAVEASSPDNGAADSVSAGSGAVDSGWSPCSSSIALSVRPAFRLGAVVG